VVVDIDRTTSHVVIDRNGERGTLDLTRDVHWEHGYVRTVYGAQGRTCDDVILHIDTTERNLVGHESFYVGLSRARANVEIVTDDVAQLPSAIQRSLEKEAAIEVVRETAHIRESAIVFERTM
jgi:ATP-dependent exoDNAse (exonuclease V) alpha subunit